MRLDDWLSRAAEGVPGQPALIAGERTMTFAELEQGGRAAARRLAGLGVGPGDRVALFAEASIEHAVLLHGLAKLGAVAAPLDPQRSRERSRWRCWERSSAALVVREPGEVLDAPERADATLDTSLDSDAPHCVIHTSGTSGRPKAVTLTYGNHLWNAVGSGVRIGVSPSDRWLCCLPLHHIGGFAILVRGARCTGSRSSSSPSSRRGRRGRGRAPRDDRLARAHDARAAARRRAPSSSACAAC